MMLKLNGGQQISSLLLPYSLLYGDNRKDRRERGERINENIITACRIIGAE
jgi:hypothetical protein